MTQTGSSDAKSIAEGCWGAGDSCHLKGTLYTFLIHYKCKRCHSRGRLSCHYLLSKLALPITGWGVTVNLLGYFCRERREGRKRGEGEGEQMWQNVNSWIQTMDISLCHSFTFSVGLEFFKMKSVWMWGEHWTEVRLGVRWPGLTLTSVPSTTSLNLGALGVTWELQGQERPSVASSYWRKSATFPNTDS